MIRVETGAPFIARYDNVFSLDACSSLVEYIQKVIPRDRPSYDGMPWDNRDSLAFVSISDLEIRKSLDSQRFLVSQLIHSHYRDIVYPHYSELVVWREGKSMPLHKDDGQPGYDEAFLWMRKYSVVVYLNDDYSGGETVIKPTVGREFVSVPKTGSIVIFKSNEECMHGVTEITSGTRFTHALWFTDRMVYHETVK